MRPLNFSPEDLAYIRASDKMQCELAAEFNCSPNTIGEIVRYEGRYSEGKPEGFVWQRKRRGGPRKTPPKIPRAKVDKSIGRPKRFIAADFSYADPELRPLCPCCLKHGPRIGGPAWADDYGHRCEHGEPCPAFGTPRGDNCAECAKKPGSLLAYESESKHVESRRGPVYSWARNMKVSA